MPSEQKDSSRLSPKTRHPNQTPPALTRHRQQAFLQRVANTGRIKQSCLVVGIDPSLPHYWATASVQFAKKFADAKIQGEKVLLAAYEHELDEVVEDRKNLQYTSNLRMFRMKYLEPRYRDSAEIKFAMVGPNALFLNVPEVRPLILPAKPVEKPVESSPNSNDPTTRSGSQDDNSVDAQKLLKDQR